MDPYIEHAGLSGDFNHGLIFELKAAISAALPDRYIVLADERSYISHTTAADSIDDEHTEGYLEIYELHPERRLVTCIEALSPSNKRYGTPGWHQYVRKRQAYLAGAANFVEIDLLRGGRRMPMFHAWPEAPLLHPGLSKTEAPCTVWPAHY
jgi:hypothetical protein